MYHNYLKLHTLYVIIIHIFPCHFLSIYSKTHLIVILNKSIYHCIIWGIREKERERILINRAGTNVVETFERSNAAAGIQINKQVCQ